MDNSNIEKVLDIRTESEKQRDRLYATIKLNNKKIVEQEMIRESLIEYQSTRTLNKTLTLEIMRDLSQIKKNITVLKRFNKNHNKQIARLNKVIKKEK